MIGWISTLVLLVVAGAGALQQPIGPASIGGLVIDAADAKPIRRATVTLNGPVGARVAVTDDAGRFSFDNLSAGRFTLTAARLGYVTTAHGAARGWRSPGVPIVLTPGQATTNITLKMPKGGVISGRVTDPQGRPLEDLWVSVAEPRTLNGQLSLASVPANGTAASQSFITTTTDDRGVYRIYGLPPGTFVVSAYRLNGDPMRTFEPTTAADVEWARRLASTQAPLPPAEAVPKAGYVPVYFPGTVDPVGATQLTLAAGEERAGMDFQIDAVRFSTISGTVTGPAGEAVSGVMLFAVRVGTTAGGMSGGIPPFAGSDQSGQFTIRGVPPGRFSLLAQSRGRGGSAAPPSPALFAKADVSVDGTDVSGVNLQLLPGVSLSGRVVLENSATPMTGDVMRTKVRVSAPPAPLGAAIAIPAVDLLSDGSFTIPGVGPGAHVLSLSLPDTLMVKSARLGGHDLTTAPLEVSAGQPIENILVTLTDRVTEISGRLLDQTGVPAPDFYVLAYPADRARWLLGKERLHPAVRPDTNGRYRITGLPPGEYYLAALPSIQPDDFADPMFLEMLVPASLKLTIGEGERKTQDVRLAGG